MARRLGKLFLVTGVLALTAAAVQAQQIQGTVRYGPAQKAAQGVLVRCSGTGGTNEHLTDPNGRFYFRVSPGHYDCSVRVPGFREEYKSVDLIDTQSSEYMDFRLKEEGENKPGSSSATKSIEPEIPAKARDEFAKGSAAIAGGKKENLEEGVVHLEKAVGIFPQYLQAHLMLGTTYMDLQQFDKAEQALKKMISIDPKTANAQFALGEIYLRQKKDEEAEKILLQGLQVEDRSYQGHLTLARVYVDMAAKIKDEAQNRPLRVKAYEQVNESLKYNADNALAHWIKGNLLLSVGRDLDGQHEFEEYLRLDPKGPMAEKAKTLVERIKKALDSAKKP